MVTRGSFLLLATAPARRIDGFLWHGVMDRPYKKTLYTGVPSGAYYYRKYVGWRFKRGRRARASRAVQ